jgi:mannose-6-phosphate isomerase-like protein (cupin superfamily)
VHIRLTDVVPKQLDTVPIVARRIVGADDSEHLSMTHMEIDGDHPQRSSDTTDFLYWVLSGEGWFEVADEPRFEVKAGEAVLMRTGVRYRYGGKMEFLNFQAPPFRSTTPPKS